MSSSISDIVRPMFYNVHGDKTYFYMGDVSFYMTNEEVATMKNGGLSHENILTFTYEMLINKKLADFSEMVPLFEDRFH